MERLTQWVMVGDGTNNMKKERLQELAGIEQLNEGMNNERFRFTVVVDVDREDADKMDHDRIHDEVKKAITKALNGVTMFEISKFIIQ